MATANSLVKYLDRMMEAATKTKSGIKKISQAVGDAGTRCFPPLTHDSKIGGRLDLGDHTDGGKKRRLKVQVNKNAENTSYEWYGSERFSQSIYDCGRGHRSSSDTGECYVDFRGA